MELLKHGLSTDQIEKYLENVPGFVGCYPSNKIPEINSFPCTLIINTAQSGYPGDHWVALHLKEDVAFYFDSFGFPILEYDIFKFLKKYYKKVIYNRICIQDLTSIACGLFCIAFVKNVFSVKSYNLFKSQFSSANIKENDCTVLNFI